MDTDDPREQEIMFLDLQIAEHDRRENDRSTKSTSHIAKVRELSEVLRNAANDAERSCVNELLLQENRLYTALVQQINKTRGDEVKQLTAMKARRAHLVADLKNDKKSAEKTQKAEQREQNREARKVERDTRKEEIIGRTRAMQERAQAARLLMEDLKVRSLAIPTERRAEWMRSEYARLDPLNGCSAKVCSTNEVNNNNNDDHNLNEKGAVASLVTCSSPLSSSLNSLQHPQQNVNTPKNVSSSNNNNNNLITSSISGLQFDKKLVLELNSRFPRNFIYDYDDLSIENYIAKGGGGSIFQVIIKSMNNRQVAGKFFNDPETISRSLRECEVALKLHHRNIVSSLGLCVMPVTARNPSEILLLMELGECNLGNLLISTSSNFFAQEQRNRILEKKQKELFMIASSQQAENNIGDEASSSSSSNSLSSPNHQIGNNNGQFTRCYLPFDICIDYAKQIASGLAYLHTQKPKRVIHCDLKLANVLVFDGGRTLKLCDLGLARETENTHTDISLVGVGTARFLAREGFTSPTIAPTHDVYAFGAILFTFVTSRLPHEGLNFFQMATTDLIKSLDEAERRSSSPINFDRKEIKKNNINNQNQNDDDSDEKSFNSTTVVAEEEEKPISIRPGCPQQLVNVCRACIDPDPQKRPKDGVEIIHLLQAATQEIIFFQQQQQQQATQVESSQNNNNSNHSSAISPPSSANSGDVSSNVSRCNKFSNISGGSVAPSSTSQPQINNQNNNNANGFLLSVNNNNRPTSSAATTTTTTSSLMFFGSTVSGFGGGSGGHISPSVSTMNHQNNNNSNQHEVTSTQQIFVDMSYSHVK